MGVDGMSDTSEQKIDELLNLMRSFALDPEGMNDAGRIGFVYKYDYNPDATYEKLDVVLFGPSLWTPKQNTTGNAPPDQSQPGQESIKENEFWQIYLPGALGADYVKKTDLSKPPTETEAGKPGVNFPDGKTIQMDENGMLTGTPLDFNGTWDELFAGIESGEVKNGMIGYIKGSKSDPDNPNHPNSALFDIDDYLSLISSNAVQNRIITAALNQIKQLAEQNAQLIEDVKGLRASVNAFGLAKVCPVNVTDVTEDNGTVLGGWEKNTGVSGTLAYRIAQINDRLDGILQKIDGNILQDISFSSGVNTEIANIEIPDYGKWAVFARASLDGNPQNGIGQVVDIFIHGNVIAGSSTLNNTPEYCWDRQTIISVQSGAATLKFIATPWFEPNGIKMRCENICAIRVA